MFAARSLFRSRRHDVEAPATPQPAPVRRLRAAGYIAILYVALVAAAPWIVRDAPPVTPAPAFVAAMLAGNLPSLHQSHR